MSISQETHETITRCMTLDRGHKPVLKMAARPEAPCTPFVAAIVDECLRYPGQDELDWRQVEADVVSIVHFIERGARRWRSWDIHKEARP